MALSRREPSNAFLVGYDYGIRYFAQGVDLSKVFFYAFRPYPPVSDEERGAVSLLLNLRLSTEGIFHSKLKEAEFSVLFPKLLNNEYKRQCFSRVLFSFYKLARSPYLEIREGPLGLSIFAKKEVNENQQLNDLTGVLVRITNSQRDKLENKPRGQSILTKTLKDPRVGVRKRVSHSRIVVGPLSIVNHACKLCAQVLPFVSHLAKHDWKGATIHHAVEKGQELFVCYGGELSQVFSCPICSAKSS